MTAFVSRSDKRPYRLTVWAIVLGGIIGALLTLLTAQAQQRLVFDSWQQAAPRAMSADNVSVVLIDSQSLQSYGAWPWSRYHIAKLTNDIALQNPSAIGFDIIFAEPDALRPARFASFYPELGAETVQKLGQLPSMDDVFASVLETSPVVLPRVGVEQGGSDPAELLYPTSISGTPPAATLRAPQVLTSIFELDGVALAHASINGPPDSDSIIRRVPLNVLMGDQPMPGLALEMARQYSGEPELEWQGSDLLLGDKRLPADATGSLPIKFAQFPDAGLYSAREVLDGRVPADSFAGKIVLVGLGAEGTADVVATPLNPEVYGIFVQAQAIDAIIEGGWLSRPAWAVWAEMAAALALLGLILIAAITSRNWPLGVAFAFAVSLPVLSFVAFDQANLLLDPVRPLVIGAVAALAMGITRFALARAERAQLAAELVEQRVAASEQEGELKAARRIQLGMVPGPERLAKLDQRADIGAVLQPAKSVGGDFYDALMIGPDRLLFIIGDVTGKGVPAALFMALSKSLSKSTLSRAGDDLGGAVAALNRDLMAEADEEMGVTMLIGLLDCSDGTVSLINAGHENPLAVRKGGDVETLDMKGGPPFCVVDFPYATEQFALAADETLVIITDGATEALNKDLQLFGNEGVIESLARDEDISAPQRATDLADRVRAFEGDTDPSDDLTIFALRYLGAAA